MIIPHYINENKSNMRGIKPGWYAMDDGGKLSSGPFSSREDWAFTVPRMLLGRADEVIE
jgi:hypothetical protein